MRYVRKNTMARSSTGGTPGLVRRLQVQVLPGQQTIREQHGANNKKRLHLISGRSNLPLAKEIAEHLGVELAEPNLAEFANGRFIADFRSPFEVEMYS